MRYKGFILFYLSGQCHPDWNHFKKNYKIDTRRAENEEAWIACAIN